jgi:hypothetical protein
MEYACVETEGKKQNPPDAEKYDSIRAEKINSRIKQLFKKQKQKQLKQKEIEKMKIKNYPLKITTRKGGKKLKKNSLKATKNVLLFSKPVPSKYCVKDERQKPWANMPQPNPKVNPEASKSVTKQPMLQMPTQKLEADMPSETMPTEHGRDHHHHQGAANQDQKAVVPPNRDLDDAAINAEMVKMQITLEKR